MAPRYPLHMYHETLPPVYALDQKAETKAAMEGYGDKYRHQAYPRAIYHENGDSLLVKNADEESRYIGDEAKRTGWSLKAFPRSVAKAEAPDPMAMYRSAKDAQVEVDNFQKIQDLEYEILTIKDKYEKLFVAVDAQADAITMLQEQMKSTPKTAPKKEPEKVAS